MTESSRLQIPETATVLGRKSATSFGITQNEDLPEQGTLEEVCGALIKAISVLLIILTFPFSLCVCLQMIQVKKRRVLFVDFIGGGLNVYPMVRMFTPWYEDNNVGHIFPKDALVLTTVAFQKTF